MKMVIFTLVYALGFLSMVQAVPPVTVYQTVDILFLYGQELQGEPLSIGPSTIRLYNRSRDNLLQPASEAALAEICRGLKELSMLNCTNQAKLTTRIRACDQIISDFDPMDTSDSESDQYDHHPLLPYVAISDLGVDIPLGGWRSKGEAETRGRDILPMVADYVCKMIDSSTLQVIIDICRGRRITRITKFPSDTACTRINQMYQPDGQNLKYKAIKLTELLADLGRKIQHIKNVGDKRNHEMENEIWSIVYDYYIKILLKHSQEETIREECVRSGERLRWDKQSPVCEACIYIIRYYTAPSAEEHYQREEIIRELLGS